METLLRFLLGGTIVSAFAITGSLFKPTSFAGLFGAAPSVALATLLLAIGKEGRAYASVECRSMIAGSLALGAYSLVVSHLLVRYRLSALRSTLASTPLWFAMAFGLWQIFLR
jgi:hypothetical protein